MLPLNLSGKVCALGPLLQQVAQHPGRVCWVSSGVPSRSPSRAWRRSGSGKCMRCLTRSWLHASSPHCAPSPLPHPWPCHHNHCQTTPGARPTFLSPSATAAATATPTMHAQALTMLAAAQPTPGAQPTPLSPSAIAVATATLNMTAAAAMTAPIMNAAAAAAMSCLHLPLPCRNVHPSSAPVSRKQERQQAVVLMTRVQPTHGPAPSVIPAVWSSSLLARGASSAAPTSQVKQSRAAVVTVDLCLLHIVSGVLRHRDGS